MVKVSHATDKVQFFKAYLKCLLQGTEISVSSGRGKTFKNVKRKKVLGNFS